MKSYDRWRTEGVDIKCDACGYVYTEADGGCDPCELSKEEMEMEDTYVYLSVKLYLKGGADVQEVVQECDYKFEHDDILETEIHEILDTQEGGKS
tara:strand:+ start:421 stop:705 length:285 start_codon:yes stop_codon:yes gene_type:complete